MGVVSSSWLLVGLGVDELHVDAGLDSGTWVRGGVPRGRSRGRPRGLPRGLPRGHLVEVPRGRPRGHLVEVLLVLSSQGDL